MANSATMLNNPHQIAHYRLLVIKSRLNLESKGVRHSSGALRPRIAAEFGLKPRDSLDKYIAAVQAKIDESFAASLDRANDKPT